MYDDIKKAWSSSHLYPMGLIKKNVAAAGSGSDKPSSMMAKKGMAFFLSSFYGAI
jgi:hypothetical protein